MFGYKFLTEGSLSLSFTHNIKADKKNPNSDMQKHRELNNLMQQSACNKAPNCRVNSDILLNRNFPVIRVSFIDLTLIFKHIRKHKKVTIQSYLFSLPFNLIYEVVLIINFLLYLKHNLLSFHRCWRFHFKIMAHSHVVIFEQILKWL